MKLKKGDVVGRISYGNDILFTVDRIIKTNTDSPIVILKGLTHRIVADAPLTDLKIINKNRISNSMKTLDYRLEHRINKLHPKEKKKLFKRDFPREYKTNSTNW